MGCAEDQYESMYSATSAGCLLGCAQVGNP